ncbi:MAG: hypothetical protein NDI81_20755 [Desulfobacula sp.]|nr:hypothetical protein [Desulfobacula sp.]
MTDNSCTIRLKDISIKIFPTVFLGLALIFAGCTKKGVHITEEEEIVFRSHDYPEIEIRIAKDIRYMKGDAGPAGKNPAPGGSRHDKKPLASRRYTFMNPHDPTLGCIKMVNIEIETFETDEGRWVHPDFKVFPGVIRYGRTRFNGVDYQYGIALNPLFTASPKDSPSGPVKMISKIYSRVFGDDASGIVTISYSESLPEDPDWHPASPLTEKRRQFLDGFLKRCDRNLVIMN